MDTFVVIDLLQNDGDIYYRANNFNRSEKKLLIENIVTYYVSNYFLRQCLPLRLQMHKTLARPYTLPPG